MIVDIELKNIQRRLDQKNIKLSLTVVAKKYLVQKGYDPVYGARPLKRIIQNEIMDDLALQIIEGKIKEGERVKVDIEKDKIIFKK